MYTHSRRFQTAVTPPLIRQLIQVISAVTLTSVLLDAFFSIGIQTFLAVTPLAYLKFFFWQPFTALFLIPSDSFSFSFLLDLAFSMLILWLLGALLLERIGAKRFFTFYVASGLISAFTALFAMYFLSSFAVVSACLPALLAIATLWTMSDPNQQLNLFFIFPLRAKWILIFALIGTLLVNLVDRDLVRFSSYAVACIFSYFYGLLALNFRSPFEWMSGFEEMIKKMQRKTNSFFEWKIFGTIRRFRSSRKEKEDQFIDTVLEKISKKGKSSLRFGEKIRLNWISLKRKIR
jgi:membrane associated rhomboid family serine protease